MSGRGIRSWGASVLALMMIGCAGGSEAYREGRKAELRKDYDTALVNFDKAVQNHPDNAQYLLHQTLARNEASLYHLKRGQQLLKSNQSKQAEGEFEKAVSIDPSNMAAAQELGRLLAIEAVQKKAREQTIEKAMAARQAPAYPPRVELKPFPDAPIPHIHITGDSRLVFQSLGQMAGLNVAFTPDFQARPITLDLTNVKLEDALKVVSLQTKSFWVPVTSNTILVVQDTPVNRRDYEQDVLKTVYLSNPLQQAERTQITNALKQILLMQHVTDNPEANAIIIRDTPERVAEAEQLIHDLDQGKAEILIEVAVIEADTDRIRDLGLTPGALSVPGLTLPEGAIAGVGFTPPSTTTSSSSSTTTTTSLGLPLNQLGKLSTSDFSIALPGAAAAALLSDSRTHILQNPQIRVSDGETTTVKIGSRIPYATGSFAPSFGGTATGATGGIGLLASTQFQFQDVGVNLELTPTLVADGEVSLKSSIEISSLQAPITVGGVSQPTFGQRSIKGVVRLKEGEVNLIGGLIESTITHSKSGLPGLGDIPGLGRFFTTEHTENNDTEIMVMLTPRVIRLPDVTPEERATNVSGDGGTPVPGEGLPAEPIEPPVPGQPPGGAGLTFPQFRQPPQPFPRPNTPLQ